MAKPACRLLAVVVVIVLLAVLRLVFSDWRLQTDIQAVVAQPASDPVVEAALARYQQRSTNVLITALGPLPADSHSEPLLQYKQQLAKAFAAIGVRNISQAGSAIADQNRAYFQRFAYPLLTPEKRQLLLRPDSYWLTRAQRSLMQPGAAGIKDIWGLARQPAAGEGRPLQDFLLFQGPQGSYLAAMWRLPKSPFDANLQLQLQRSLEMFGDGLPSEIGLLTSGVVVHAAAAAGSAKTEIRYLGGLSLLGILLLAYWAFGGLRSVLLLFTVVGSATVFGALITAAVFAQLHLLTLLLGSSVLGMSADYVLHVLSASRGEKPQIKQAMATVRRAVGIAALTTVAGYAWLFGSAALLSQLAVFTASGLLLAAAVSLWLLPSFSGSIQAAAPRGLQYLRELRWPRYLLVLPILAGLATFNITSDNSPENFYYRDASLQQEQQQIAALFGLQPEVSIVVLRASSQAELRQQEAELIAELDSSVSWQGLPRWLGTDLQLQTSGLAARQRFLDGGLLKNIQRQFKLPSVWLEQQSELLLQPPAGLPQQMRAALPQDAQTWDLSADCDCAASWMLLSSAEPLPETLWNESRQLLQPLRQAEKALTDLQADLLKRVLWMALAMLLLLGWLYRTQSLWQPIRLLAAPLLAAVAVLGVFASLGLAVNVFHIAGLLVTVGLGLDYQIFRQEAVSANAQQHASEAVWLSVITSALAFGMLGFSQTPAVAAFGQAVLLGLVFNTLLAFMAPNSVAGNA